MYVHVSFNAHLLLSTIFLYKVHFMQTSSWFLGVSVQLLLHLHLFKGKSPLYPLNMRLRGPQICSWYFRERTTFALKLLFWLSWLNVPAYLWRPHTLQFMLLDKKTYPLLMETENINCRIYLVWTPSAYSEGKHKIVFLCWDFVWFQL